MVKYDIMVRYNRLRKLLTDNYILKEYYRLHYLSLIWPVYIEINSNLEYNYQPCITKIILKGNNIYGYIDSPFGNSGWYSISPKSGHTFSNIFNNGHFLVLLGDTIRVSLKKEWNNIIELEED